MLVIKVFWKVGNELCHNFIRGTDDPVVAQKFTDERIVKEGPHGQRSACLALVTPCEVAI